MALQLRDHLHWCNCEGRAVFLDTEADRYFCLPKAANDAFLRLAAHAMQPEDRERLQMVVARGLLVEADGACMQSPPAIEAPTHEFLEGPLQGASLPCTLRALVSELCAAWALRTKSFHDVIETVRSRRPGSRRPSGKPDRSVREIVSASVAASLIARSHDRCLVRALAVHSMCRKSGHRPKLVFGVIAHPFTAHCWVQLGSAVLVGGHEQARLHTPILVLE